MSRQANDFQVQPGWRLILADMGLNPGDVLIAAGLPADLFARAGARVSTSQYFAIWRAVEALAEGQPVPLRVGKAISVEAFDPAIFASLCSPNLNTALQRLAAFKRLIGPIRLDVETDARQTALTITCLGTSEEVPASMALTELVFFVQLSRLGTRQNVVPHIVETPHLPGDAAPYRAFFGTTPSCGAHIRVVFRAEDGVAPFLTSNPGMWSFFEPGLRESLASLNGAAAIAERVRAALLEALPAGEFSVDDLARKLAVSKRTLQRQLSEAGSSYSLVLDSTRADLARHYLRRKTVANGEIAFLLGFEEVNSFIRAFKGWTGMTPQAYQRQADQALKADAA